MIAKDRTLRKAPGTGRAPTGGQRASTLRAILFDFGGTLDGPGVAWLDRFLPIYRSHGISVDAENFRKAFFEADDCLSQRYPLRQMGYLETLKAQVESVLKNLGCENLSLQDSIAGEFYRQAYRTIQKNIPLLQELRRKYRLGVISNFYGNLENVLKETQLISLLDVWTDSSLAGCEKPDPRIFQATLEKLQLSPAEALFVGDSVSRDMVGAARAGMPHAWLSPSKNPCLEDISPTNFPCCRHPILGALQELPSLLAPSVPAGIIAAGTGQRLKALRGNLPKALFKIQGKPLLHHTLGNLQSAGIRRGVCILNTQGKGMDSGLQMAWIFQDTASSWESFRIVADRLAQISESFLVTTVDALYPPQKLKEFLQAASKNSHWDAGLAITPFVEDEKPLWAEISEKGRIVRLGSSVSNFRYATCGLYYLRSAFWRRFRQDRTPKKSLREFWIQSLKRKARLGSFLIEKAIDVDRPEDVKTAEEFLKSMARPPSGIEKIGERVRCLGIYREPLHSPNRIPDDALILESVLQHLQSHGLQTEVQQPRVLDSLRARDYDLILPMCESPRALEELFRLQNEGAKILNSPQSVLACYRTQMVPRMEQLSEVLFPPTRIYPADSSQQCLQEELAENSSIKIGSLWIKRGDVHNTCDRDVVRPRNWSEWETISQDFRSRGIAQAVFQKHIEGDLLKFYGVGPGRWFCWFYHDPARVRRHPFALPELQKSVTAAAQALQLEIFGGDAIVTPHGEIYLIDLNSWPSFAKFRAEASEEISKYILSCIPRPRPIPTGTLRRASGTRRGPRGAQRAWR
ncbi:MAG: HAD-IA family hydrolase [Elusimicrobia bacterium]|nr:HAD-IA family hydrolase [Elusimicrobiota bacterium]